MIYTIPLIKKILNYIEGLLYIINTLLNFKFFIFKKRYLC